MRLEQINLHPLKSGAIRPVEQAGVTRAGLAGDRRWMVVDPDGVLVSARMLPELFTVAATARPGTLHLRSGDQELEVAEPDGEDVPVRLHRNDLLARESETGGAWLSELLGRPLRLVWCPDPTRRRLNPAYSREGDHAAFPDGYPVTVVSRASFRQLQDWMTETALERGEEPPEFGPERFRPNLVVDGDEPFAEDRWATLRVGEVSFRVAKPVDRCVMTTIAPADLARGPEPIRTLARHRKSDGATWFAVHLIPDGEGRIAVGDEVTAT